MSAADDVLDDDSVRFYFPVAEVSPHRLHPNTVDVLVVDAGSPRVPYIDRRIALVVNHVIKRQLTVQSCMAIPLSNYTSIRYRHHLMTLFIIFINEN